MPDIRRLRCCLRRRRLFDLRHATPSSPDARPEAPRRHHRHVGRAYEPLRVVSRCRDAALLPLRHRHTPYAA